MRSANKYWKYFSEILKTFYIEISNFLDIRISVYIFVLPQGKKISLLRIRME